MTPPLDFHQGAKSRVGDDGGMEETMRVFENFASRLAGLLRFIFGPARPAAFTCGDCERRDRCGQPPSDGCVVRAAQVEALRRGLRA